MVKMAAFIVHWVTFASIYFRYDSTLAAFIVHGNTFALLYIRSLMHCQVSLW